VDAQRAASSDILVEPWLLTENDIPWLVDLCKRRYSNKYDPVTTEGWFRNIVLKSPVIFNPSRMPNAFCISMLSLVPWLPSEIECSVIFICAEHGAHWEGMKLLRSSIEWARTRKSTVWKLQSDTDYDLSGMAKRLGATEIAPRYVVRF
jgi:hypothetical protein